MLEAARILQQRQEAETEICALFSGKETIPGIIKTIAKTLLDTPGVKFFHTPVPWKIRLPDRFIIGNSLDMENAACEIYAQAVELEKHYPPDVKIGLFIDGPRLQNIHRRPSLGIHNGQK